MTDAGVDSGAAADSGPPLPAMLGPAARPAEWAVPPAYDGTTPLPALILLHGYGASGEAQNVYFGLTRLARAEGFYLILPDGTTDASGRRFWNATPSCCDFGATGVDDVAYITSLLDDLEAAVPVDTNRVYLVGHSNGGFMSYRMACERSARITGIASLAGADYRLETDCVPTQPVSVLQIHGSLDATIPYAGLTYPSAPDAVARWAGRNGCDVGAATAGTPLDITLLPGAETEVLTYPTGCMAGAELWTIVGGGHIPAINTMFSASIFAWLQDHAR